MRLSYDIPATADDWVQRVDAACRVIEDRCGVSLSIAESGTKFRATTKLIKDRRKYLQTRLKTVNRWFCFHNDSSYKRTPSGFMNVDYFMIGGTMNPDGVSYRIEIELPEDPRIDRQTFRLELSAVLQEFQQAFAADARASSRGDQ